MDFDANLSVTDETLRIDARSPQGEDDGTAPIPQNLGYRIEKGELGRQLFELLFPMRVRALFERCRGAASIRGESVRLRIRVCDDPTHVLRLQRLPWELLQDPGTRRFLALGPEVEIVRYLQAPLPVPEALILGAAPLDVLVVIAAPRDRTPLSSEVERKSIETVFAGSRVRVTTLVGATRRALGDALRSRDTHVVHFIGHAIAPTHSAEGALLLEQSDGSPDLVSASSLALMTQACPSLRLVVLNSCWTGHAGPFELASSLGPALALGGVPAVVAMNDRVSDSRAVEFARVFYQTLREGRSIEASLRSARLALADRDHGDDAWMIPALFTRMQREQPAVIVDPTDATATLRATRLRGGLLEVIGRHVEGRSGAWPGGSASATVAVEDAVDVDKVVVVGARHRTTREGSS